MRWFIRRAWGRSIRRQLILGVALVHAVLMTLFIADLVLNQRRLLHSQALESAQSLAQALAVNSQSWVLSNDIMGLEEVVSAQRSYPDLRYGMVLSPDGRVLAHTARRHQGRYVTDEISARLLDTPPRLTRLVINEQLIDVAQPITARGELIGWARIGLSQARTNAGLRALTLEGLYYTILALILGSLFAYLLSRRITRDLYRLARVSTAFVAGDEGQRALDR
ncbi:hypothetical protein KKB55_05780 [Myxococcota bacterium]|nr:hypothetical protein [Myxococcota bacterium]MBU1897260.1 hypothetical protein [Myxococcota bacterium]